MAKRVPPGSGDTPRKKPAPRRLPTAELPPDDLQAIFGQNVKIARLKCAMTQEELAEATGINLTYIGKIEQGAKNVTLDTMRKLAVVLGLDLGVPFRPAPSPRQPSPLPPEKKDD